MGARGTVASGVLHASGDASGRIAEAASAAKLLLVDHAATRLGIRMALDGAARVCAECYGVEEAIRAAKLEQPEIAFVGRDISGDWRAAVRGICRAAPECRVIVLAETADADDLLESVRAGALGYVPGTLTADSLRAVFRFARANEALIPRTMVGELLTEIRGAPMAESGLTVREAQVLGMVRRGHSTAWIAECLAIAPVTVRRHISQLVRKLGVGSRSDLVERPTGRIEAGSPVRR